MIIHLNCFILGENPYNRNFQMPVNTERVNSIGMLKSEINTFQMLNIPTRYIELWRINFSLVSVNEEIINNCANINVSIHDTLAGTEFLVRSRASDEFPTQRKMERAQIH